MADQGMNIKVASAHQSGTYLISEADLVSLRGTRVQGPRKNVWDSLSDRMKTCPSSVTVLNLNAIGNRLSSLDVENLNSERLANKNGSLNREDFANIKIGTSYSDLVNTVGIPNRVSWSHMMSSEFFLIFYYELSDAR